MPLITAHTAPVTSCAFLPRDLPPTGREEAEKDGIAPSLPSFVSADEGGSVRVWAGERVGDDEQTRGVIAFHETLRLQLTDRAAANEVKW